MTITQTNFTPKERATEEARQATPEVLMDKWVAMMELSDIEDMPRWMEFHIETDHGGVTADPIQQEKYNAKKAKRATKPGA